MPKSNYRFTTNEILSLISSVSLICLTAVFFITKPTRDAQSKAYLASTWTMYEPNHNWYYYHNVTNSGYLIDTHRFPKQKPPMRVHQTDISYVISETKGK